jgi:hypothetical protein
MTGKIGSTLLVPGLLVLGLLVPAALATVAGPAAAAVANGATTPHATAANPGPASQRMSAEDTEIALLKTQVAKLTSQVTALQSQLGALQSNVAAFHTQFDKHTHVFSPYGLGINTFLTCASRNQPCDSGGMQTATVFTPEQGSPGVTMPPSH